MTLTRTRAAVMAGILLASGAGCGIALANQGHMVRARNALYAARSQLLAARHDKGGHRAAAIRAIDAAIAQVNAGIQVGR